MKTLTLSVLAGAAALSLVSNVASAGCASFSRTDIANAVAAAKAAGAATGGYGLPMWATMVDETGMVCYVVTSGTPGASAGNSEWLGSRVISAQKASTANAFSLDGYAISTANLYKAVQPGGSLYGLQFSNPVDPAKAYAGSAAAYGTMYDPLVGQRVGGVNVFGGGLALYKGGKKVGAIGVSGDTSCRDHAFAWRMRTKLAAHPGGTGITTANYQADGSAPPSLGTGLKGDEMIFNINGTINYWDNNWVHPTCPRSISATLKSQAANNGVILN